MTMPGPMPPLTDLAGGTLLPGLNSTPRSQPRLVFSMPYNAAFGALITAGGKCTPLRKRTVRDDNGAMLWLKNAAVRATPTA